MLFFLESMKMFFSESDTTGTCSFGSCTEEMTRQESHAMKSFTKIRLMAGRRNTVDTANNVFSTAKGSQNINQSPNNGTPLW